MHECTCMNVHALMTFQDSRVGSSLTDEHQTSGIGKVQIRRKRQSIMARTLRIRYLQKKRKSGDEPLAWRIMQLSLILVSPFSGQSSPFSPQPGSTVRLAGAGIRRSSAGLREPVLPPGVDHRPLSQSARSLIYSQRSD